MAAVTDLEACRALIRSALDAATDVVAFTGAGISTEAGIPDFRSPGSLWTRNKPIPFQAFVQSREARTEAWRRKFAMDDATRGAAPAAGHRAIASLLAAGKLSHVITQNIDGLHQASGVPDDRLIEIHGNGTYATCLACGLRHELGDLRPRFEASGEAPNCVSCDGPVKSATISFGQAMPETEMRRARAAALGCDLFLVIGSSLVVYPAAALPVLAKEAGARLVILNREPTDLDSHADLVLRGEIGPVMQAFLP